MDCLSRPETVSQRPWDSGRCRVMRQTDLAGVQLGKYHIAERLDTGGIIEVYKAYQPDLDRHVAIKVIASDPGRDPAFLEQFEREAKMLARLEHPNILPIYDSGRYGGMPYLVMQYIREGTLAERMDRRPLAAKDAVSIVCQVGDALSYAHAMGVVHRNVKPANVFITESGRALLADFGIMQTISRQESPDDPGAGSGTSAYVAPEQRAGKPVDGRTDIYALGVLLYELLTGRHASEQTLLTRSLSAIRIPGPLREVIASAGRDNPDERYDVAEDFVVAAQEALLKVSGEYAEPPTPAQQALETVAIAIFLLLGLGLGIYTAWLIITVRDSTSWMVGAMGASIWMGALTGSLSCLVNAALLMFRDRTRALSFPLLATIGLVFVGGMFLIAPLMIGADLLAGGIPSGMDVGRFVGVVGSELLCCLPGVLLLFSAAGFYAYDRRQSQAAVRRNIQRTRQVVKKPSVSAARRARFITRKTRDYVIGNLIGMILMAAAARIVAYFAPYRSALAYAALVTHHGLTYVSALLGVVLVVWHTYVRITSASDVPADHALPQDLSDVEARLARLEKAREYQARIQETVAQTREGPLRERLQSATRRLDDWVAYVERLTTCLNEFERDPIIRRNRSTVPRAIHALEARLALDRDTHTDVKDAVRQTLRARHAQLRHLHALERMMARAELCSDETVAALSTIYSQVLLVDARDVSSPRVQRLRADMDEQVQVLSDLLDAINEVQEHRQDAVV
jgi:hypothetical protein